MTAPQKVVARIENLSVAYKSANGWSRAVDDVSLHITNGEVLGLAGESGSGKTTIAYSLLGELRGSSRIDQGHVEVKGRDIFQMTPKELAFMRGRSIGFVPQNPMVSLTPSMKVGEQIGEMLRFHGVETLQGVQTRVVELLDAVGIPNAAAASKRYPHELSGGQQQRVAIAIAIACRPDLIVLDEPTTGLDVTTQKRILELLAELKRELSISMLYVSHDLASLAQICDRVAVMQRGRIVEDDTTGALFRNPQQAYTRKLIAAVPRIDVPPEAYVAPLAGAEEKTLLEVENLRISYAKRGLFGFGKIVAEQDTVKGVSFTVSRGETFAIIGESGSGKSSIARSIAGLIAPKSGSIRFSEQSLPELARQRSAYLRQKIQIIFQNPDSSLNPRKTVRNILERSLVMFCQLDATAREKRIVELLESVQLPTSYIDRYPHQLSGGERQRVAIARALAAEPELIICDEILSALDVSVQASVLELLAKLQREHGLTYLFISHDLAVVRWFANEIGVLSQGAFAEIGGTAATLSNPFSAYTRELLNAVPQMAASTV